MQRHPETFRAIRLELNTLRFAMHGMPVPAVVESWSAAHAKLHFSLDDAHDTDDLMGVYLSMRSREDRHEIGDLCHTRIGEISRQQDICFRKIELLGAQVFELSFDTERTTLFIVEQGCENGGRVKAG